MNSFVILWVHHSIAFLTRKLWGDLWVSIIHSIHIHDYIKRNLLMLVTLQTDVIHFLFGKGESAELRSVSPLFLSWLSFLRHR
jgi:hypothetical protein